MAKFISQSTGLLLEDETHSTHYHEHTAKYVFKRNNSLKHLRIISSAKQLTKTACVNKLSYVDIFTCLLQYFDLVF